MNPHIAISIGDPCGIGPEITIKALEHFASSKAHFHVFSPADLLNQKILEQGNVSVHHEGFDAKTIVSSFENKKQRASIALQSLDRATHFCASRDASLVTAPLDKSIVREILPAFTGHTEHLAQTFRTKTVMLLANDQIACALLTHHISLREVAQSMSQELLIETTQTIAQSLNKHFQMKPFFCLAGLNPHAGEISQDAEEQLIFAPAIEKLRNAGYKIDGPFAADSLYTQARNGSWDVILSPFHDQGLVAIKYPGLHTVVNITCGLPILRVSPGHGTAYDIAGKNKADPRSMIRAIEVILQRRIIPQ